MSGQLSWLEAGVVGALQGVAELFPISSLGHSVLLPAWVGGSWQRDLDVSSSESPYLAFIVGLHVATAIALVIYFWRDWVRIIRGLVTSIARREVRDSDQRLAWMLVIATIPVGIVGLVGEHFLRTHLGKPVPTAIFLTINGLLLFVAEHLRRGGGSRGSHALASQTVASQPVASQTVASQPVGGPAVAGQTVSAQAVATPAFSSHAAGRHADLNSEYIDERVSGPASDERLAAMPLGRSTLIGALQILALAPGLSRSGVATVAGMLRGLSREDAARFSFLLATPVILAAGALKLGDLSGPLGNGIRGQVLFGSVLSGVGAYLSIRFLTRYLANRSLRPFGAYCIVAGVASLVLFAVR